jgi:hypothetical protein
VISFTPGRFTPEKRAPGTHCIGDWVESRAVLDEVERRKFLTLPELEPRPLGRPARCHSLYRLRYPCDIRKQVNFFGHHFVFVECMIYYYNMAAVWNFVPSFIIFDQIFKNLGEDWTVAHRRLPIIRPYFFLTQN